MKIGQFVEEYQYLSESIRGRILFDFGWGNGYIAIPQNHPCYGIDYDSINSIYNPPVRLSFSRKSDPLSSVIPEEYRINHWILGFDTMHYGMTSENWPKSRVVEETAKLAFRFYEIWVMEERKKNRVNQ